MIRFAIITGWSMSPVLRRGDLIGYCTNSAYELGDIIVFKYKSQIVAHRLLSVSNSHLIVKGDNYFRKDDLIKSIDVIGVAKYVIRSTTNRHFDLRSKSANRFMLYYSIFEIRMGDFLENVMKFHCGRKVYKVLALPYYVLSYCLFLCYAKYN
jgi:signal peptidase I